MCVGKKYKMKHYIHFAQPLFGREEKKEVLDALDSGWVTLGPRTKQFEENFANYIGAKYAIAVSSCTAALHLSLIIASIKPGDEVITTPFTFAATLNTILHAGATPIFVDIEPKTFLIDVSKIEAKITKKTKAIIPVHYAGQPVDMNQIAKLAKKYNLIIIEDAAHALGTEYKGRKVGSFGNLTCFSFHPIKNISTGDGGMITTNNKAYAKRLKVLRLHGMSKDAWKRHDSTGSWKYDIEEAGYKYNMTDIQAALGIHQLKKLDSFIKKREEYAQIYDKALSKIPEITIPYVLDNIRHARNLYTIMIGTKNLKIDRDELVELLKQANIGVSVYFVPLHLLSLYKRKYNFKKGDFPIAETIYEKIISLPLYPKMKKKEVIYVIETLRSLIENNRE